MTARSVVFAYHDVGARCLRVLRAHGIDVPLVVTHADDPRESCWFERVAGVADDLSLPWIAPVDANAPDVVARLRALAPDYIFSFYYRRMLAAQLLAIPARGALNMHGSLLPAYRGRAPVNWAIANGERVTGATLHYMIDKPDAGDIVAQQAVPILPDDTAREVFQKVTVAAEIALDGVLPALLAGHAPRRVNDVARGSYFGGRTPEHGRIDWSQPATRIHDLVRAVAPPYPGALTTLAGAPARVLSTRVASIDSRAAARLRVQGDAILADCGGGGTLRVRELEVEGDAIDAAGFIARFGTQPVPLV
jgi:methionyl-tRNA formyltransferase